MLESICWEVHEHQFREPFLRMKQAVYNNGHRFLQTATYCMAISLCFVNQNGLKDRQSCYLDHFRLSSYSACSHSKTGDLILRSSRYFDATWRAILWMHSNNITIKRTSSFTVSVQFPLKGSWLCVNGEEQKSFADNFPEIGSTIEIVPSWG